MVQRRQRMASATQTTKPSARSRRSAEYGRRSVVGTEACGFVHRRSAVRIPSGCAAPTGANAAHGADTKARRVLRRDTKRLRGSSRSLDSELSQEFAQRHRGRRDSSCSPALRETVDMRIRLSDESLTRSHGGTEFLHGMMGVYRFSFLRLFSVAPCLRVRYPVSIETRMSMNGREKSESLFVNRLVGEPFSCRTEWARSAELLREKVINTERTTAGRIGVYREFRFAQVCRLRCHFRAFGFNAKNAKGERRKGTQRPLFGCRLQPWRSLRQSLCGLCVEKDIPGAKLVAKDAKHVSRDAPLAPRSGSVLIQTNQNRKRTK